MFKMNLYLKLIIIISFSILLLFINNYIVLLLLLLLLFVVGLLVKNAKSLLIDLLLLLLFILSCYFPFVLVIYKILFIFNMIYLFIKNLSIKEKKYFYGLNNKYDKSSRREFYYSQVFEDIKNKNLKRAKNIYSDDVSIDNVIESDLERSYLQAKIRFYGYKDESFDSIKFSWRRLDTEIALFCVIIFILCIIFG